MHTCLFLCPRHRALNDKKLQQRADCTKLFSRVIGYIAICNSSIVYFDLYTTYFEKRRPCYCALLCYATASQSPLAMWAMLHIAYRSAEKRSRGAEKTIANLRYRRIIITTGKIVANFKKQFTVLPTL